MRIVLLTLLMLTTALSAADSFPLSAAVECRARGGLPNVVAKLKAGKPVRVAYFGGSITAAEGWRVKTLAWLQAQYPRAKLSEINAAIGGTGSDLGVYRCNFDVLRFKPDLVFVEFAVNDGGANPLEIQRCMEGIARQIWAADPTTDICYVYTLVGGMVKELQDGHFPRAASAMETIADHYGIPSIHFGLEIAKRVADGSLIFKAGNAPMTANSTSTKPPLVFTNDDTHPLDAGHEIYAQIVARNFPSLAVTGKVGAHVSMPPLIADHYQRGTLVSLERAKLGDGWIRLDPQSDAHAKEFAARMPVLYRTDKPGTKVAFRFKGTAAALYDLLGPDCGQVSVVVDGGKPRVMPRFDSYTTYHRLSVLKIASNLPDTLHTVEIQLDSTVLDKAKILLPARRPDFDKNPSKYVGNAWYAGAIMLIGELVE